MRPLLLIINRLTLRRNQLEILTFMTIKPEMKVLNQDIFRAVIEVGEEAAHILDEVMVETIPIGQRHTELITITHPEKVITVANIHINNIKPIQLKISVLHHLTQCPVNLIFLQIISSNIVRFFFTRIYKLHVACLIFSYYTDSKEFIFSP